MSDTPINHADRRPGAATATGSATARRLGRRPLLFSVAAAGAIATLVRMLLLAGALPMLGRIARAGAPRVRDVCPPRPADRAGGELLDR